MRLSQERSDSIGVPWGGVHGWNSETAKASREDSEALAVCRSRLEVDAAAELERACGTGVVAEGEAGDVSECSAANGYVGIADEFRVVEQVERLDANLEVAFTVDLEAARDACVDVGNARSAEFVAASVAKDWRDHARGHRAIDVTRERGWCIGARQGWRRRWDRTRACRRK